MYRYVMQFERENKTVFNEKKKKKVTELVVRPFCYVYIYMYVYTVILVSNKICLNYK